MGVLAFLVDWGIESMNGFKFAAVRASVADSGASGARPCHAWPRHVCVIALCLSLVRLGWWVWLGFCQLTGWLADAIQLSSRLHLALPQYEQDCLPAP
jgi:hypothetical protein